MNNSDKKIWTVSEVNKAVRELLENSFHPLWIRGEIGDFTCARSGHVYFTLKDQNAQVKCVFFNGALIAENEKLKKGTAVEIYGHLSLYEPRGDFQIQVKTIKNIGAGDLYKKFEALKDKLKKEGLFETNRKKPIPMLPKVIGVITSPDGAAIRDFLKVINTRFPNLHIRIYPASVQGSGAEYELARGIRFFNTYCPVDVIVLTRGGGSIEDLWPFNEEVLAREIFASKIPVISAVGHEIDFSISDFVADLREATPSTAAVRVIGKRDELIDKIRNLRVRIYSILKISIENLKRRTYAYTEHRIFSEPKHILREKQQLLDDLVNTMASILQARIITLSNNYQICKTRLSASKVTLRIDRVKVDINICNERMLTYIGKKKEKYDARFQNICGKLNALSPMAVLRRGYAVISNKKTGKIVRFSEDAKPGEDVTARTAGAVFDMRVISATDSQSSAF